MNDSDFKELEASIVEAGKIRRGELEASRKFEINPPDIRAVRSKLHVSQIQFAAMIGVSPRTLQNWEQGRRVPRGPARALLRVASRAPKAVAGALK
ncbi:MAG: helix-turn-helix domain-containing protein [Lentisphaeria bacterium]|nr:helix-turn-helix domain-containing protein [Lentisphaeria bacterium]